MSELLVRPIHSVDFLRKHDLGVEAHIGRYDTLETWHRYIPFVRAAHLPYPGCNLAAIDDTTRQQSIAIIKEAIANADQYSLDRIVMHVMGIEAEDDVIMGTYDRLIDAIVDLAEYARKYRITLCLENTVLLWDRNIRRWGDSRDEWYQIYKDTAHANVKLNLDTSHAVTEVHRHSSPADRIAALWKFLDDKEAIWRVHWSDSIISNEAGKEDMHLVPGQGDLPRDFHAAISRLPVPKLLEQNCSEQEVEKGLQFVDSLAR